MKNRLKELRKTRSWSQADLARALNISRQAVNGFESGKFTPSLEMAFKMAGLFNVAIESIFLDREKSPMQNLLDKVKNFSQWLPKGERFTKEAIEAIAYAQLKAALLKQAQVEPEHILCGLLNQTRTTAAQLLREHGLTLDTKEALEPLVAQIQEPPKVNQFSPESKYVLELALNAARLKQQKYIDTEHLLLALIQLMQLGNDSLIDIFQSKEVNVQALVKKISEL